MSARVLIVEDAESTRKAMKTMLLLNEHEICGEAENGEEAVEMYGRTKPDVVLMDIAMPKKHGIDAIREIRQMDPDARIIGVTALYSPEKKREALKAGASSIIVKPFDVSDLIREIEALFRNKTDAR